MTTSSLMDDIDSLPAPEPPEESPFGTPTLVDDDPPVRTRQRRPRQKRYDEDGNEIKATRAPRAGKLQEDLLESTVSLASDISAFAPTVAGVLISRAEVTVDGLMSLAAGHKRTTAALKKVASVSKVAGLLEVALLLIVAGAADFGRIPTDSPILDRVGYAEIIRDEKGKPKKDAQGLILKDRKTIRDIRLAMGIDDSVQPDVPPMPAWNAGVGPDTGSGPAHFAAMNDTRRWSPAR